MASYEKIHYWRCLHYSYSRSCNTVTWINEDEIQHNAMHEHEGDEEPHDVTKLGLDPNEFEGPMLAKGEKYSYTFNDVSEYLYHCAPHPWMKGKVQVVEYNEVR